MKIINKSDQSGVEIHFDTRCPCDYRRHALIGKLVRLQLDGGWVDSNPFYGNHSPVSVITLTHNFTTCFFLLKYQNLIDKISIMDLMDLDQLLHKWDIDLVYVWE